MMDRKKTILVAVLINAGLLVVLFIAALTTQDETTPQLTVEEQSPQPFFTEPVDLAVKPPPLPEITPTVEIPSLLSLPPVAVASESAPMPTTSPAAAPSRPSKAQMTSNDWSEVTVKKGDSLEKIAKAHQTTVDELIKFNHLPSTFLRVGQVLKIPAGKGGAALAAPKAKPVVMNPETAEYYTVKVGDNPWTIAMKHHMKVDELLKLNNLNEEKARKLKAGDRLRIR